MKGRVGKALSKQLVFLDGFRNHANCHHWRTTKECKTGRKTWLNWLSMNLSVLLKCFTKCPTKTINNQTGERHILCFNFDFFWVLDLTKHFTILEPQNPYTKEFYFVEKRPCLTLTLLNVRLRLWYCEIFGRVSQLFDLWNLTFMHSAQIDLNALFRSMFARGTLLQFESLEISRSRNVFSKYEIIDQWILRLQNWEKVGRVHFVFWHCSCSQSLLTQYSSFPNQLSQTFCNVKERKGKREKSSRCSSLQKTWCRFSSKRQSKKKNLYFFLFFVLKLTLSQF